MNLPLAEMLHGIQDLIEDPTQEIVVTCGGRARAVLGCQSLINAGVTNPVSALYYGTMGWDLAGFPAMRGAETAPQPAPTDKARAWAREAAARIGTAFQVPRLSLETLEAWRAEDDRRTLYLIDVRRREEYEAGHHPDSRWVPGGQLVGVTEDHIATRNARLCLLDDDGVRATLTASWMRQMGWPQVAVLEGGLPAWQAAGGELATGGLPPCVRPHRRPTNNRPPGKPGTTVIGIPWPSANACPNSCARTAA